MPRPWPGARLRRAWFKAFRNAPMPLQVIIGAVVLVIGGLALNWTYQVIRKPSELFFPVSGTLYKTPAETWDAYERIFKKHSTPVMNAHLLAAFAQVEGSGNPIVRTYWRWSLTAKPFDVYRPASSAVGMYQITDGTFQETRRYCVHDHVVVEDGPWNKPRTCWFNSLYSRVVPSHAVEMTSAYLDRRVTDTLRRQGFSRASVRQKRDLAAVIHLCGAGAGDRFARRGLSLQSGQRCGDHDVRVYVGKVRAMQAQFARLDAGDD